MVIKTSLLKLIFILIVYCMGILYIIPQSKSTMTNMVNKCSVRSFFSSENMCYLPDGSSFKQDRLSKLVVRTTNSKSAYVTENDSLKTTYIPKNYTNLVEFIELSRAAIMSRRLIKDSHSIWTIFLNPPYEDMVRPSCDGLWMEFGVYRGNSITRIATWKRQFCGKQSQPVYGFDTFNGLPTNWRYGHDRGRFEVLNESMVSVPSNVMLVKGFFIDTLPVQLLQFDREYQCHTPVSFVHIDCDTYEGARDVLFLLGSRFVSGTIIVFDELFNYPNYEQHEIKALFEFLSASNLRLRPVGSSTFIELKPLQDIEIQSFAFVVDLENMNE